MKKPIIILALSLVVIIAAIVGLQYYLSFHKVTISLGVKVDEAAIYNVLSKDKVKNITENSVVSLQNGDYYIVPSGKTVDTSPVTFTVNNEPLTVVVDPGFSRSYLQAELEKQLPDIRKALVASSTESIQYTFDQPTLYKNADWFGALLVHRNLNPRDEPDYYRVVAQKSNGKWKIIGTPELVLTKDHFEKVPVDILSAVNHLRR